MSKLKKYIYHNQHQHCYDAHNLFIKTDYATVDNQALNGALLGGGTVGSNAGVQPYKYSTKELDRQNGLDWYDADGERDKRTVPLSHYGWSLMALHSNTHSESRNLRNSITHFFKSLFK